MVRRRKGLIDIEEAGDMYVAHHSNAEIELSQYIQRLREIRCSFKAPIPTTRIEHRASKTTPTSFLAYIVISLHLSLSPPLHSALIPSCSGLNPKILCDFEWKKYEAGEMAAVKSQEKQGEMMAVVKSQDKQWYYLIGVASSQKIYLELIY